mgnify:CR=1 FL=1
MKLFLLIIEFTAAIILIAAILLHQPKGEGLGGIGGQARVFNTQKGMESGLNRFTGIVAAIFLIGAIILSVM